ncbi:MAG: helix-turn-helix domain-containing protein, partial [Arenimonas sp.]
MADSVIDLVRLRQSCAKCSLQTLCLPAAIGVDDMEQLDRVVRNRRPMVIGDHLYRSGQTLSALYVAREGAFKTTITDEQGQSQVIGFHLPGELIGLDALGSGTHACDAQALTQANVCEVPLSQLEAVAAQVPGLQHQLLRIIGQSINRDHSHLEMLGVKSASDRMALFLHGLSERYRLLGRPAELIVLPMSRQDIGSYLGLVIETVSRSFNKLQEDGVISVHGRQVKILDMKRLSAMAHITPDKIACQK